MEKGLTSKEAELRLVKFGKNQIDIKREFSAIKLLISQFPTFINGILFLGLIFSVVLGNVIDAFFIAAILIISGLFGFLQEYNAEKSLEKLKNFITPLSRVLRDGKEKQISTYLLVPGDTVVISEGDYIPADGEVILSHHLEVDESVLTGESMPVEKDLKSSVYSATTISKGRGLMVVGKTGINTKFGEISKTLSSIKTDKTPLQKNLINLGKIISVIAIIISFSLIPIGLIQGRDFFNLILLAISAGVAAIPEGLPAVITIALAIGTNRMAKKSAIVRKMSSVETLGAVQIILSDKTGTLTKNEMTVKEIFLTNKNHSDYFYKACVIGNTASLIQKTEKDKFEAVGDKTDSALLMWVNEQVENLSVVTDGGKVVDEFVFDPKSKLITSIWEEKGERYVFVRGASEKLMQISNLNEKEKAKIQKEIEEKSRMGLRIIGTAFKKIEKEKINTRSDVEENLNFLGFLGIYDPPRPEAKEAIIKAKNAGIKTIMVTGDSEITALQIAKEVGLIDKDEDVVTGSDLDNLSDSELEKIILKTSVFARTKPEDKLRLVGLFKKMGFVVGVTGDGVNDALALKKADVGVSMGKSGTDVAKEASDIVLSDDNYSTLISAVFEGRAIYSNILKSIMYLLSGNLSEISLIFFATLLKMPDPLLPTQILWINLVTDGLPALALASDNRDNAIFSQKPRQPGEQIITRRRLAIILLVGLSLASVLLLVFSFLLKNNSETFSRTIIFNLLIFSHMILAFIIRGGSILKLNNILIISVLATVLIQIIISTNPFLQEIFHLSLKR